MVAMPETLPVAVDSAVDPVTLQVVHNRLETLMRLMTRTLEQLSGNEVTRESGDYSTAYMDAGGEIVAFGSAVCTHLGHEVRIVPWILEHFPREEIKPGDIFISNDPYTGGAVHSNDVAMLATVFSGETLIGWVFCDLHCGDVGGMAPGSMSPECIDVIAEAVRFPPTKIYDGGHYRADVVRAFLNNSRIPQQLSRDLSAEVGALHIGVRAMQELAAQYGAETLHAITAALRDFSEAAFRARLRAMPDGVYEGVDYQEDGYADQTIYRAFVRMTIAGDELYLDWRGSSPSAPALINCSESGLIGGVMGPLIQQLATGIPFNAGVMRPVHVRADRGSFINASYPTPVGVATGYGAWRVQEAFYAAASLAMQASDDPFLRERATAQWGAMAPTYVFNGINQYGAFAVFVNQDSMGEGQGAMAGLDGGRGNYTCISGSIPSVEAHERTEPFLYLTREVWRDSGGAGRWRGGWSIREAVIAWGEQSGPQGGIWCSDRNAVPSQGIFGGYPGSGVYFGPICGTDTYDRLRGGRMPTFGDLERDTWDRFEPQPSKSVWPRDRRIQKGPGGDVFVMTFVAGGGYGDPLLRDPLAVSEDVREGVVSAAAARAIYGVVLEPDTGEADAAATATLRADLREARVAGATIPAHTP
ncbi:MAG: hydantoinase B/oxoprolinase family protein [Gammaproteobacteria bacterium]